MAATTLRVPDPLEFFPGEWTFEREIDDGLNGQKGSATGQASFEVSECGLTWTEHGELHMNGHSFDASRKLEIVCDTGGWLVRFDDGRPFHPLDLSDGRCAVGHPCRDDFYSGEFTSTAAGFATDWRVTGPRKDQHIVTTYRRI